ncbi:MAG: exopolyphosphatase [Bacillus sp. (in: firmicutes)]
MIKERLFAAISVGSQSVTLKIYDTRLEKAIETRKADVSIGSDIYTYKEIEHTTVLNTCNALAGFVQAMKEYGVTQWRAVATSSVQEATNAYYIKEQIYRKTGLELEWLSNAEERYLHNQAVAYGTDNFQQFIHDGTMLIDIGSGSIQLTVYNEGNFQFSRNIKLGPLRVRELLKDLERKVSQFTELMEDFILSKIDAYQQFATPKVKIEHFILIGTDLLAFKRAFTKKNREWITREHFDGIYNTILSHPEQELTKKYMVSLDAVSQLLPSAMLVKKLLEWTGAKKIFLSTVDLVDGLIVHEYMRNKKKRSDAFLYADILEAAKQMAAHYQCTEKDRVSVEKFALHLFDRLKSLHGLKKRDRLLLQLGVILRNIGSFVTVNSHYLHSYYLIKSTELIGISEEEQLIVANLARYHSWLTPTEDGMHFDTIQTDVRLRIAKLAAILRVADALNDSKQQKITSIRVSVKEEEIVITPNSKYDLSLERWTFIDKAEYFEKVYGKKLNFRG